MRIRFWRRRPTIVVELANGAQVTARVDAVDWLKLYGVEERGKEIG